RCTPWAGSGCRGGSTTPPWRCGTTPRRWRRPGASPSCSRACPTRWPRWSPRPSRSRPSASAPAPARTARCSSTTTCSASRTGSGRSSSAATPRSARCRSPPCGPSPRTCGPAGSRRTTRATTCRPRSPRASASTARPARTDRAPGAVGPAPVAHRCRHRRPPACHDGRVTDRPRLRRPTLLAGALLLLVAACGDGGDGSAAGDEPPAGTATEATGEAPGGTGRGGPAPVLTEDALAAASGGAPAARGAGLDEPPGPADRRAVAGEAEVAAAITAADGRVTACCLLVAAAPEQRQRGLMEVEGLGGYAGMVFVWDQDTTGGFWMRDTIVPLSIAWF